MSTNKERQSLDAGLVFEVTFDTNLDVAQIELLAQLGLVQVLRVNGSPPRIIPTNCRLYPKFLENPEAYPDGSLVGIRTFPGLPIPPEYLFWSNGGLVGE